MISFYIDQYFVRFPFDETPKSSTRTNHSAGEHFGRGQYCYTRGYTTPLQLTLFDIPGMQLSV